MKGNLLAAALALTLAGCSAHAAGAAAGSRNLLAADQMLAIGAETLYQAIERLRPEWLLSRAPTSITDSSPTVPSVFVGGSHLGDVEYLRRLRVDDVSHVRYFEPGEASVRFGMGHPRGGIDVVLKGAHP